MAKSQYSNYLLQWLPAAAFAEIEPHLIQVTLRAHEVLESTRKTKNHVWFPETCQVSLSCKVAGGEPIDVGMIGREGMTPMPIDRRSPLQGACLVGGDAYCIDSAAFEDLVLHRPIFANLFMRFGAYTHTQSAFNSFSNGRCKLEERLARCLLMLDDRLAQGPIRLAHEVFSWMLAVRRPGVTEAFKSFRTKGCIETGRGQIRILDRVMLKRIAAGTYGPAEEEYERLLGRSLSSKPEIQMRGAWPSSSPSPNQSASTSLDDTLHITPRDKGESRSDP